MPTPQLVLDALDIIWGNSEGLKAKALSIHNQAAYLRARAQELDGLADAIEQSGWDIESAVATVKAALPNP